MVRCTVHALLGTFWNQLKQVVRGGTVEGEEVGEKLRSETWNFENVLNQDLEQKTLIRVKHVGKSLITNLSKTIIYKWIKDEENDDKWQKWWEIQWDLIEILL